MHLPVQRASDAFSVNESSLQIVVYAINQEEVINPDKYSIIDLTQYSVIILTFWSRNVTFNFSVTKIYFLFLK